jgi:hypothetical protein
VTVAVGADAALPPQATIPTTTRSAATTAADTKADDCAARLAARAWPLLFLILISDPLSPPLRARLNACAAAGWHRHFCQVRNMVSRKTRSSRARTACLSSAGR